MRLWSHRTILKDDQEAFGLGSQDIARISMAVASATPVPRFSGLHHQRGWRPILQFARRWSDGSVFTPVVTQTQARSLNYQVEIPLQSNGVVLPERTYTVEAWLNTQPEEQFAAAANILRVLPQPRSTERRQQAAGALPLAGGLASSH